VQRTTILPFSAKAQLDHPSKISKMHSPFMVALTTFATFAGIASAFSAVDVPTGASRIHEDIAQFSGRIVSSRFEPQVKPKDVIGCPVVMVPNSVEDVAIAARVNKNIDHVKMIVTSGRHITANDARKEGTDRIVVDMQNICSIDKAGSPNCVKVGASATMYELGKFLVENEWFLPLSDVLPKSVVGTALSGEAGMFSRSKGLLHDKIACVEYVDSDGELTTVANIQAKDLLTDIARGIDKVSIVCSLEFQCEAALACNIQSKRYYFPYVKDEFRRLIDECFVKLEVPKSVDLSIRVRNDVYGVAFVCIAVSGSSIEYASLISELDIILGNVLEDWSTHLLSMIERTGIIDVTEDAMHGGFSGALEHDDLSCTIYTRKLDRGKQKLDLGTGQGDLLQPQEYCQLIEIGLGHQEGDKFFPNIEMIAQVKLNAADGAEAEVYLYMPKEITESELKLQQLIEKSLPPKQSRVRSTPPLLSPDNQVVETARSLMAQVKTQADLQSVEKLIMPSVVLSPPLIDGFAGDVYTKISNQYAKKTRQYATTSYPIERTSPYMVAYPKDAKDIAAAIFYAKQESKKIVTRSGGHQYCGLSSGGNDTIVLSMDNFAKTPVVTADKKYATVGPGCKLTDIAAVFKKVGVTIPHGECPGVCIGGHVQTGGFGHLLRSFGLALDHVKSFDIVLSDGSLKTVVRPDPGEATDDIYWAVLGGGPGSFGVVTEIVFECIRDLDHPKSFGYCKNLIFEKNVFKDTMTAAAKWTANVKDSTFPPDVDLMVTAASHSWDPLRPFPIILLEMVHGNYKGKNETHAETEKAINVFDETIKEALQRKSWLKSLPGGFDTRITRASDPKRALSFMSDAFVRRGWLGTTVFGDKGREFHFPYMKRLFVTEKPLTMRFVEEFTDLVDEVINGADKDDIKVVFQMALGGGQVKNPHGEAVPTKIVSMSSRNYTICIVFDIFYNDKTKEIKRKAENFLERMQILVDKEFKGDRDIRMQWGSFGDTNMSDETIVKMYYDNTELYNRLQKVKQKVDPEDVFHTEFTVQLPRSTELSTDTDRDTLKETEPN
jgi:FAD/FMN-containing dehydrogenase